MKKAAIIMGGFSGEKEISNKSGDFAYKHIDKTQYTPLKTYITLDEWFVLDSDKKYTINKSDFSYETENGKQTFDVIYNTIHGTPGEDGYIQAYLDLTGIPYTGCNSYTSALTFNKIDCNTIVKRYGVKVADSLVFNKKKKESILSYQEICNKIGSTFMVKAARSGSSIGVTFVNKEEHLATALENAFAVDDKVLIEAFIKGTEVSVGVFRDIQNQIQVLELTEIVSDNSFFDFDAKYNGESKEVTPARLEKEVTEKVKTLTKEIYNNLDIEGIARIDFIIKNEQPYFIEVNTNPGLSPQSIFPQQAAYKKIDLVNLFTSQLKIAENKKPTWSKE